MKIDPPSFPPEVRRLEVLKIEDDGADILLVTAAGCHVGAAEMTKLGLASPITWDETSERLRGGTG